MTYCLKEISTIIFSLHFRHVMKRPTQSVPRRNGQISEACSTGHFEKNSVEQSIGQNCWVSGLFPPPGVLENRKHDVSETGFVSVLR
jgi:hypothetical protein